MCPIKLHTYTILEMTKQMLQIYSVEIYNTCPYTLAAVAECAVEALGPEGRLILET